MAAVNATLILIAVCLFLAWKIAVQVDRTTDKLAEQVAPLAPLAQQIQQNGAEMRDLTEALRNSDGAVPAGVQTRLTQLQTRQESLQKSAGDAMKRINALLDDPGNLIDQAVETGADALAKTARRVRGCHDSADTLDLPAS